MIFGLTLHAFTILHVVISLIGIAAGLIVVCGFLTGKPVGAWTAAFLISTVATSVTGFGFPFHKLEPPHIVGIISLVVLAVAIVARYTFHLAGPWRWIYVVNAVLALYLNVFVLIVQLFQKVPALKAIAPKQTEPPFAIAQLLTLALFVAVAVFSVKRFRGADAIRAA